jgi:hypothetical protein
MPLGPLRIVVQIQALHDSRLSPVSGMASFDRS